MRTTVNDSLNKPPIQIKRPIPQCLIDSSTIRKRHKPLDFNGSEFLIDSKLSPFLFALGVRISDAPRAASR